MPHYPFRSTPGPTVYLYTADSSIHINTVGPKAPLATPDASQKSSGGGGKNKEVGGQI